jgi:hypothetical protein
VERSLGAAVEELRQRYGMAERPAASAAQTAPAKELEIRSAADSQLSLGL